MSDIVDIETTVCQTCGRDDLPAPLTGSHVTAVAIIDEALRGTMRDLISSSEVRDLLLDLRQLLAPTN